MKSFGRKRRNVEIKSGFLDLARYLEDHHIPYGLASSNYREDIDFYLKERILKTGLILLFQRMMFKRPNLHRQFS